MLYFAVWNGRDPPPMNFRELTVIAMCKVFIIKRKYNVFFRNDEIGFG